MNARDESFATPLHNACENINGADLVNLFLEHHADLTPHDNTTRSTPLHRACRQGAFRNVQLLLTHGANPNTIDIIKNTPLHVASQLGCVLHTEFVGLLIFSLQVFWNCTVVDRTPCRPEFTERGRTYPCTARTTLSRLKRGVDYLCIHCNISSKKKKKKRVLV